MPSPNSLYRLCGGLALTLLLGSFALAKEEPAKPSTDNAATPTQPSGVVQATPAVATIGAPAPDFTLTSATGDPVTLSNYQGNYVVLEWVNFGCPFVRKHYDSQNMQDLQAQTAEKDVVWLSICSSKPGSQGYFAGEALLAELEKEQTRATAYLVDADGTVGHLYEAKATPTMIVIDPAGTVIYTGAIDDKPTPDTADVEGAMNYVLGALWAHMEGKPVEPSATKAYGCGVKY